MTDNCEIDVERMEVQEVLPKSAVEVVTNCSSTDLEVGGSVGISVAEERVVGSRRASIAIEESAQEETKRRCAVEKGVAWKIFKSIVFVICLVFLVIQSVEFLGVYYKYPTKIETEITLANDFKLPAITFCFSYTMSFKDFCFYEPDRCERPRNMEEFCRKRPIHCRGNTTNLKIPTNSFMNERNLYRYFLNDSYNDVSLFRNYNYTSKARTFIGNIESSYRYFKCYSENLHLYQSRSKAETRKFDFSDGHLKLFNWYEISQRNIELFYPMYEPKVFFGIHSLYVPIDITDLNAVRPDKKYLIDVQLEKEEHLLPPPYQTDCRDNGHTEYVKESTNPNSFQMCLQMCRFEKAKAIIGCDPGLTMVSSPSDLCVENEGRPDISEEQRRELDKKQLMCMQNCKQGCLKLQYKYRIMETNLPDLRRDETASSYIFIIVKNPEVTVLRHVPLYGSGDVFSHIGGLLGCWLGISVFTFTDIVEKFFRKVVRWKKRFRKKKLT